MFYCLKELENMTFFMDDFHLNERAVTHSRAWSNVCPGVVLGPAASAHWAHVKNVSSETHPCPVEAEMVEAGQHHLFSQAF